MTSILDSMFAPGSSKLASLQAFLTHAAIIDLIGSLIEHNDRKRFFLGVSKSQDASYEYHWMDISSQSRHSRIYHSVICSPSPMVALSGCSTMVETRLEKALDANGLDSYDKSSLLTAFKKYFGGVAGILLMQRCIGQSFHDPRARAPHPWLCTGLRKRSSVRSPARRAVFMVILDTDCRILLIPLGRWDRADGFFASLSDLDVELVGLAWR